MKAHELRDLIIRMAGERDYLYTSPADYDPTKPDAAALTVSVVPAGLNHAVAFFRVTVEKVEKP